MYLFNKYLWSAHYVPNFVLDAEDTIVSTPDVGSAFRELTCGERDINQKNYRRQTPELGVS